jgi:hypothetical protein
VQGTEQLPAAKRLNTRKQCKNKCVGALYQLLPSPTKNVLQILKKNLCKKKKVSMPRAIMQSTIKSSNKHKTAPKKGL